MNKLISLMVRQAHHERNQYITVHPELVEGLVIEARRGRGDPAVLKLISFHSNMPDSQTPTNAIPPAFSAGVVVVRRENAGWGLLVLRAFRNWDFPKGMVEPNETPLNAAIRETAEEASITDLVFRWGETFCETAPYGQGKVARYYLAETKQANITLPISPELGHPEHDEWRWVNFDEAERLLPSRLQPILVWARKLLQS